MKRLQLFAVIALALLVWVACEEDPKLTGPGANPKLDTSQFTYQLVDTFPDISFSRPVDIRSAGDSRLFVVEQAGIIKVFDTANPVSATDFLDISSRVACCGELGLLGLAFHPDYATNGYFYVYYTAGSVGGPSGTRVSCISRFQVSADPNLAEPTSERLLLEMKQRADNHNGGGMAFDDQGYLHIAIGDEGGGGDTYNNAQDLTTLHGSILRLDVNQSMDTKPYHGIPADNPFFGNTMGYREEIYAYGLRNPWRISYDLVTDRIWCGDVGQVTREEVDVIENGMNYGWDCREGFLPYTPNANPVCDTLTSWTDPVHDYPRSLGNTVTGGYVYRGSTAPSLTGKYVFADYGAARIWTLDYDGVTAADTLLLEAKTVNPLFAISTFGVDMNNELYLAQYTGFGKLYTIEQVVTP